MTYRNQTWGNRIDTLGDPAESAFEQWATERDYQFVRYGLCRPPVDMRQVEVNIRYTPDYLTNFGLVEVQGCGKDRKFKFKHEKLGALCMWHEEMSPVSVWLFNQPTGEGYLLSLKQVLKACSDEDGDYRFDGLFDGYKRYAEFDTYKAFQLANQLKV